MSPPHKKREGLGGNTDQERTWTWAQASIRYTDRFLLGNLKQIILNNILSDYFLALDLFWI